MPVSLIDQLATTAAEKIEAAEARIRQLSLQHFPSQNPEIVISLFLRICAALREKVKDSRAKYLTLKDENSQRLSRENIERAVLLIRTLTAHLRYIEGARVERTPWSLVQPLERIAQDLLSNTRLIVRPQWHYDYGSLELLNRYKSKIKFLLNEDEYKKLFDAVPCERIYVISFPGVERKNILLHVNFGHEIGHSIVDEFLTDDADNLEIEDVQVAAVKLLQQEDISELERFSRLTKITDDARRIRKRALEEITADLISVRLFGPAAIFALNEVATFSDSLDSVSEGTLYPPWRTRLRLAMEDVDWPAWRDSWQQVAPEFEWNKGNGSQVCDALELKISELEQITKDLSDQATIQTNDLTRIAYQSLPKAVSRIKEFLAKRMPAAYLSKGSVDLVRDIFHLVERLVYDTPPNEIATSGVEVHEKPKIADLRSIFNAGWFYRLTYLSSMFEMSRDDYFAKLDVLQRLLLRAVEMSYLQDEYENRDRKED